MCLKGFPLWFHKVPQGSTRFHKNSGRYVAQQPQAFIGFLSPKDFS